MNIDYNRGVVIRRHSTTGVDVYMYKDTPGVFLNAYGVQVPDEMAKAAGYDVANLVRARDKMARMAQAKEIIEAEFLSTEAKREVIKEQSGFALVSLGLGRHEVLDPDGERLSNVPLTQEQGLMLLNAMAPVDTSEADAAKEAHAVTTGKGDKSDGKATEAA